MRLRFQVLIYLTLLTCLVTQCRKESQTSVSQVESLPTIHESGTISDSNTGVECPPKEGYNTCTSTCLFSDCCVQWDPKKETGGCSCFFGVARCKTEAILELEGSETSDQKHRSHNRNITFHFAKFNSFMEFCEAKSIFVSNIKKSVRENLRAKIIEGDTTNAIVNPEFFDIFTKDYEAFINSLNKTEKTAISLYIAQTE